MKLSETFEKQQGLMNSSATLTLDAMCVLLTDRQMEGLVVQMYTKFIDSPRGCRTALESKEFEHLSWDDKMVLMDLIENIDKPNEEA